MPTDVSGASWLNYLNQMFGQFGISPAAAAEAPNPYDALKQPSPVDPRLQSDPFAAQSPIAPPGPPPGPLATMPARPAGVSPTGLPLSPGSESPASLAFAGPNASAPWPSGGGSMPDPNAPSPAAQPVSAVRPNPAATGGAPGALASSNPRFTMLSHDVSGGGRTPYISALNLGGLFGGGQPAAANPANVPAPNAQPVSAQGPLAKRKGTLNLPTSYNIPGSGYRITPQGDVVGTLWGRPAGGNPY
jgi:hypothetical protein